MLLLKIKYNENKEKTAIRMKQNIQKNKKKQYTYIITRKDYKISIINGISEVFTTVKIQIVIL